jgi:hypothetical protein
VRKGKTKARHVGRLLLIPLGLVLGSGVGIGAYAAASTGGSPTVGPIPATAKSPNGALDPSQVPDFVPVLGHDGHTVVGYIKKQDLLMTNPPPPTGSGSASGPSPQDEANIEATAVQPVYGSDLQTIVGHMYPNVGFVPVGQSPNDVAAPTPTTVVLSP